MKLKNLEALVGGGGEITISRIGPIRCAAIACDDDQQLAALVRRRSESLEALLERHDAAIEHVWEHDEFTDEING